MPDLEYFLSTQMLSHHFNSHSCVFLQVYLKKYGYLNAPLPSEGRRPPPREMKAALR